MSMIVIEYYYGARCIEIDRYDDDTVLRRMNKSISEATCHDISNAVNCASRMRTSP
jgi:hypothetical protein